MWVRLRSGGSNVAEWSLVFVKGLLTILISMFDIIQILERSLLVFYEQLLSIKYANGSFTSHV